METFIADLRVAAKDDSYGIAAFLRDRIDDEIDSIQSHYRGNLSDEDKADLILRARIIATYLLLLGKTDGHEFQQKFLLLLETLSVLSPRSAIALAGKAADCLCGKVSSLGFSWIDITTALSADILAYKITIRATGVPSEARTSLTKKGSVDISSEEIKLSPYPSEEAGLLTKSLGILSDRIGLWTKDRREERLKASEASDAKSIETFINGFCTAQKSCRPPQKDDLKKYREGDSMPVLVTGFDDNGDPITDSSWGIAADIKWLKANYVKVNGLRRDALGHNVPKVTDIDSYVNFLCEEKRIYFKDSLLGNIIIEPTEDMDAICITVSPSTFEIAYLYEDATHSVGQAFRRDGNRTIPMTEVEKQKRLMKLQSIGKEVDFQIRIQEAIDQHRKIILKDYASSEVRDRFLAPINLLYGGESVWCVDLEDPNKICKQFRLSRASGVEVKDEKYPHGKSPVKSDIFRFTGEKTIHVKLRMNISAKNYLMEEYPEASRLTEKEFYKSEEGWILDTMVSRTVSVTVTMRSETPPPVQR